MDCSLRDTARLRIEMTAVLLLAKGTQRAPSALLPSATSAVVAEKASAKLGCGRFKSKLLIRLAKSVSKTPSERPRVSENTPLSVVKYLVHSPRPPRNTLRGRDVFARAKWATFYNVSSCSGKSERHPLDSVVGIAVVRRDRNDLPRKEELHPLPVLLRRPGAAGVQELQHGRG